MNEKEIRKKGDMRSLKASVNKSSSVCLEALAAGEIKTEVCRSATLLLTLEGLSSLSVDGSKFKSLEPGCIILLPERSCYVLTAAEDTDILAYRIANIMEFWEGPFPDRGFAGAALERLLTPYVLKMNVRIWQYAEAMGECLRDGLSDGRFTHMKTFELIHLLQHYYSGEELYDLICPVAKGDATFVRMILDNWEAARSKDQLASITGLSPSRFGVKFKEVFGTSPYKWMLERRSEKILYRLIYTDDSLGRIREELGFGSAQHFNDFCKKQFGSAPGKIRAENRPARKGRGKVRG